nr:hypothetical protein [Flammeovirgaceae bacterium]
MIEFLFYSLKLAVCLFVLYLPYQFLFKKTTFFHWNRVYLLGAILFSLVLPFQIFQVELISPSENINQLVHTLEDIRQLPENNFEIERQLPPTGNYKPFEANETNLKPFKSENSDQGISLKKFFKSHWMTICYLIGFSISLLSFISRLLGIFLLIRRNETINRHAFYEVSLEGNQQQVFSFFNYIFFNRKLFPANTQET